MNKHPVLEFLAVFGILACQITVMSPSFAQEESSEIGGRSVGRYLPVSGAPDEALELTAALACTPTAASETEPPPFGAGFTLLVFEPASPAAAVSREVHLSSDGERVKTVTVPYALFGSTPLIATIEDFSLHGPCEVKSSLRQVETSSGGTRSGIKDADQWRVNAFEIETGNTPSQSTQRERPLAGAIPLSGSTDETMQFVFAAVCARNTDDADGDDAALSLRLVATEPTGTVSPVMINVDLNRAYGSTAPRQRDNILLASQESVPYAHFYSRQSGPVLFRIEDVVTAPGCHMLPIIAQRADTDTGETKDRSTPFFAKYRPQFY